MSQYKCSYCDGIWDMKKYTSCPFCGAPPQMIQETVSENSETNLFNQVLNSDDIADLAGLPTPPPLRLEY